MFGEVFRVLRPLPLVRISGHGAATIARDADALTALWDDDAVLLQPGTPPVIGKSAFHDFMKQAIPKSPTVKVVQYVLTSVTSGL